MVLSGQASVHLSMSSENQGHSGLIDKNADTGETFVQGIKVNSKSPKWQVEIKLVNRTFKNINVITG
jgi:hypothetical protein